MGKKKNARAAAVAHFMASAIDAVAQLQRPGKSTKRNVFNETLQSEDAYWPSDGSHDDKTGFRVRVWYTDDPYERGRVFEVSVKEVADD